MLHHLWLNFICAVECSFLQMHANCSLSKYFSPGISSFYHPTNTDFWCSCSVIYWKTIEISYTLLEQTHINRYIITQDVPLLVRRKAWEINLPMFTKIADIHCRTYISISSTLDYRYKLAENWNVSPKSEQYSLCSLKIDAILLPFHSSFLEWLKFL